MSERRVCGVLGQPRATQRYQATEPDDEVGLTAAIIGYATSYGRYGYRRILAFLRSDGWVVNHKRMERIWRQEGLKVPIPASHISSDLQQHRYLTEKEVAAITGRAVQTLRNDRHKGQGFAYTKFGASIRYRLADILEAMESRRIETEAI